jgi:hypothetical protein
MDEIAEKHLNLVGMTGILIEDLIEVWRPATSDF